MSATVEASSMTACGWSVQSIWATWGKDVEKATRSSHRAICLCKHLCGSTAECFSLPAPAAAQQPLPRLSGGALLPLVRQKDREKS